MHFRYDIPTVFGHIDYLAFMVVQLTLYDDIF